MLPTPSAYIVAVLALGLMATSARAELPAGNRTVVAPSSGSRAATPAGEPSLGAFVGKYPWDRIRGVSFLTSAKVVAGVRAAVPDHAVQSWILHRGGPATPIVARDGKILTSQCETQNCGDRNWTVLIDPDSGLAEVCWHDAEIGKDSSRWYLTGQAQETRPGTCPSS